MKIRFDVSEASAKFEVVPYTETNGVYAAVKPDEKTVQYIIGVAEQLGVEVDKDKLHVTVMYSKRAPTGLTNVQEFLNTYNKVPAYLIGVDTFVGHKGKLILAFKVVSETLLRIHSDLHRAGARHSFLPYMPHLTLSDDYDIAGKEDKIREINELLAEAPWEVELHSLSVGDLT